MMHRRAVSTATMKLVLLGVLLIDSCQAQTPTKSPHPTKSSAPTAPTVATGPDKRVMVKSDSLLYNDSLVSGSSAVIAGAKCSNEAIVGEGVGTDIVDNTTSIGYTMNYTCFRTGFHNQSKYAIACGMRTANDGTAMGSACQAFRQGIGAALTHETDGLVSDMISCSTIVAGECGNNTKDCAYGCTAKKNMCNVIDLQWFLGDNFMNQTLFYAGSSGTVEITPARMIVGDAVANKWRRATVNDLCYYENTIESCLDHKKVKGEAQFIECLDFKFFKFIDFGWLFELDRVMIMKAVKNAGFTKFGTATTTMGNAMRWMSPAPTMTMMTPMVMTMTMTAASPGGGMMMMTRRRHRRRATAVNDMVPRRSSRGILSRGGAAIKQQLQHPRAPRRSH